MDHLNRLFFITSFILAATISIYGCSSGSGDSASVTESTKTGSSYIPGIYEFNVAIADASCSDGSQLRQGFGFTAEIIQKGEFLEARSGDQTMGRGDIDETGKFHLSGSLEEQGLKIVVVLDGQSEGKSLSGLSKSIWETADGVSCAHVSGFTGAPSKGGA